MKNRKERPERLKAVKRKLMAALCMLLVSSLLMTTVSYAWLILSIAPEVAGITTNVGANGSLEIALLNGETRQDMSLIRSGVGESLAANKVEANYTWGNLIDLSDQSFGLGEITLMPARINVEKTDTGYTMNSGMLLVPTYGYDGRIVELHDSVFSGVYNGSAFHYDSSQLGYGVRALGTSDAMSVQAAALVLARSNISTYTSNASSTVKSSLSSNGNDLFMLLMNRDSVHDDEDVALLDELISDLDSTLNYIELAIKYGFIAYATQIEDETTFELVRDRVLATSNLADLLTESDVANPPAELAGWIDELNSARNSVELAKVARAALTDGSYEWAEIKPVLDPIMNLNAVYIQAASDTSGTLFNDYDLTGNANALMEGATLTLAPGSGVYAQVADFTGNYNTVINVGGGVTVTTASAQNPSHLATLAAGAASIEAAGGAGGDVSVDLSTTYGYALDFAFRTNAVTSDLLLQTDGVQRVYTDSTSGATLGGGSYMEFTTGDASFSVTQMLELMDAVRVAFVDDQYNVLGIAKLNTSNRTTEDGKVKAPLYLYDFFVDEEDTLVMGERRKTSNVITALQQNTAKAVSVLVWLDGDIVDNTMVSATEEASLSGVLNLQFASSADLIPAGNTALQNVSADKTELNTALEAAKTTYEAGQNPVGGTDHFTTVSWNTFVDAYTYADAVNQNFVASELQVYYASRDLAYAVQGLTQVSHEALQTKIDEVRLLMGETTDVACFVAYDAVNDTYYTFDTYTQEEYDAADVVEDVVIYRVDYNENLMNSGDGVMSQIYTDESWTNLAAALYDAEAVNAYDEVSDLHLDAALTALDTAYDALQRRVFFLPYDYNGVIYYKAICDKDLQDTYGTWYDADFNRILSDLTILNLDAYAEEVEIAEVEIANYVTYYTESTTAYVDLLDEIYPNLTDEEIIALTWTAGDNDPALFNKGITSAHYTALNGLLDEAYALNSSGFTVDAAVISDAEDLYYGADTDVTAGHAESVIGALQTAVDAANASKQAKEEEDAAADTSMTADQRTVLTAAVAAAKAVEGYEGTEAVEGETEEEKAEREAREAKLVNLRAAVAAVETLLATPDATKENADLALTGINTCLTALDEKEVTAYNTLVHTVPGSDIGDVLYAAEHPQVTLIPTGYTGTDTLTFTLLTRNGVLITVERDVTTYYPAGGAAIASENDTWSENPEENKEMAVGEQLLCSAGLQPHYVNDYQDSEGNTYYAVAPYATPVQENDQVFGWGSNKYAVWNGESIKSCSWSTSDTEVLSLTNAQSSNCTVKAEKAGTAALTLRVETVAGHTYTMTFTVVVSQP